MIYSEQNHPIQQKRGSIEVICGSMFSGKTEELIRRLKRAKFAKQRVEIFKPKIDTRYSEDEVVSHDRTSIRSTPVESSGSILLMSGDVDVIGIDEAQFFDEGATAKSAKESQDLVMVPSDWKSLISSASFDASCAQRTSKRPPCLHPGSVR